MTREHARGRTRGMVFWTMVVTLVVMSACHGRTPSTKMQDSPSLTLPLGDGHISSQPRVGYVFSCQVRFAPRGPVHGGPWIIGTTWTPSAKPMVSGNVVWPNAGIAITREGDRRVVRANNLPTHPTGTFPIQPTDSAYRFDRNPNRIREQTILLSLPATPTAAQTPSCVPMGMIGVAVSGAAIYDALDAAGNDAVAYEIQDRCNGHPQMTGQYHYHNFSKCLVDSSGARGTHSSLAGYAIDGFGIYGPFGEHGARLSNADLDACHGHEHAIDWDGRRVTMYHYHATAEYPYTIGCFHGTPVARGQPPRAGEP